MNEDSFDMRVTKTDLSVGAKLFIDSPCVGVSLVII